MGLHMTYGSPSKPCMQVQLKMNSSDVLCDSKILIIWIIRIGNWFQFCQSLTYDSKCPGYCRCTCSAFGVSPQAVDAAKSGEKRL
uniref:Uncharacterized protein n=1 Tax=Romanomermis culicivorax TaxID=13658 RepID=A0A915KBI9_ROMCU